MRTSSAPAYVEGRAVTGHRAALTRSLTSATSPDPDGATAASQALVTFNHPDVDRALQTAIDTWTRHPKNADRHSFLAEAQHSVVPICAGHSPSNGTSWRRHGVRGEPDTAPARKPTTR